MNPMEAVASKIYETYLQELARRKLKRGHALKDSLFECGKGTQAHFMTAAERCQQLSVNPVEFVETAWAKCGKNQLYITPKDIVSAQNVVEVWEEQKTAGLRTEQQWKYMVGIVTDLQKRKVAAYVDDVAILLDPHQPFTAYFRVLYPEAIYKDLFDRYSEYAYKELALDLKARAYLREIRPAQLARFEELTRPFTDRLLEGKHNG